MMRRAIFLDRDGTLVERRHYPRHPEELCLYPGIGPLLRTAQQAGFALVVVTNQSGIAHGYFTMADLAAMHAGLAHALAAWDVRLDGIYVCPHHPDGIIAPFAISCTCRKPAPGLLLQAAEDLNLTLNHSWMIGDILADIEAGKRVGCRTILVDLDTEPLPVSWIQSPDYVARSTVHALQVVLAVEGLGPCVELDYWPVRWTRTPSANSERPMDDGM